MAFALSIDGKQAQSFDTLGVVAASLELSNQGLDRLQIVLDDEATLASFPPYSKVRLLHDGNTRFIGWVDQLPASLTGERRQTTVTVSGPWRWLDMTTYSTETNLVDLNGLVSKFGLQIPMLNQGTDPQTGLPIKKSLREVLTDALAWVVKKHGAVIAYDLSGGDLDLQLPWSEKQNVTAGSVVRDQLSWVPDHSAVWDYSGPVPKLEIIPSSAASRNVMDTGVDGTALALNPRFDLLVNSVTITYVGQPRGPGIRPIYVDAASGSGDAGALGSPLSVDMTFPLQDGEDLPASGLANAFLNSVSKLAIETAFTYLDETLDWMAKPGQTWGFAGVASPWAAYTSVCQSVTRDLFSRAVTVKLGHPGHLGLQQMIDLHRKNTPQARGLGGQPPLGQGALQVTADIVAGSAADKAEMIASTVITVTGPSGTQQAAAKDPITKFSNLVEGTYLVSVVPAPGWKLVSNGTSTPGKQVSVSNGTTGAQVTLLLERLEFKHPFKVLLQKDSSNALMAGVYYFSTLFGSLDPSDTITITGLLGETPTLTDPGWFAVTNGDWILLEIDIAAKSATIKKTSSKPGKPWTSGGLTEQDSSNPPKQTKARLAIAKIASGKLLQFTATNLVMTDCVIDGQLASYPIPY